jgi:general secretion pathway protein A
MYLDYWNLKKFPFENVADPSFFYVSHSHEEALSRLLYASRMRKGAAMLTGDIGCGKTLISRVFRNKMREAGAEVSLLVNPPQRPLEFLQEILYQMGVEEPPDSKTKLLQILYKKVIANMQQNKGSIIVIDEAQILPEETFEEARLLLNLQNSHRFLLTLLLIGQPDLRGKVRRMSAFDQRIPIRFHIHPLSFVDTIRYIMFREKKAGFTKNIFTKKAIEEIYEYTGGLPRKINSVCDLSLLIAFNKKRKTINPLIIESVIDDLE